MPSSYSGVSAQPQSVQELMGYIEALSKIKPKDEQEAAQLEQARAQAMYQLESMSEHELTGAIEGRVDASMGDFRDPEPERAPWASEYDMPGNWERNQSMANSLAQDEALRTALSTRFTYDPSKPFETEVFMGGPAASANFSGPIKDQWTEKLYWTGPPAWEQGQGWQSAMGSGWGLQDPSGTAPISQKEIDAALQSFEQMGKSARKAIERRYKGHPLYERLIGSELDRLQAEKDQKRLEAEARAGRGRFYKRKSKSGLMG